MVKALVDAATIEMVWLRKSLEGRKAYGMAINHKHAAVMAQAALNDINRAIRALGG